MVTFCVAAGAASARGTARMKALVRVSAARASDIKGFIGRFLVFEKQEMRGWRRFENRVGRNRRLCAVGDIPAGRNAALRVTQQTLPPWVSQPSHAKCDTD